MYSFPLYIAWHIFTKSISCCEIVGTTTPTPTAVNVMIKRYNSKIAKFLGTFFSSKRLTPD